MDLINLLISFTPFWAVPVMVISLQMAWTFKTRSKKTSFKIALFCFVFAFLGLLFFIWSGSPGAAVDKMSDLFSMFEN